MVIIIIIIIIKKSGGKADDENFYVASVRQLLTARDDYGYRAKLQDLSERWSHAFLEHYVCDIGQAVLQSASYSTSHLDVISRPYIGVTNNVSESYNRVLEDFQNWKVIDKQTFALCLSVSHVFVGTVVSAS